ncbi:MAG: phosphoribosylformylglycinamidine cyclo-ligase [Verrucomicrobiota bacterium]|nr:phosphoribosylformylglycinamidine cyclo-ligase [Verrucomicrobiota bacterium]
MAYDSPTLSRNQIKVLPTILTWKNATINVDIIMSSVQKAYARAGVDVDLGNRVKATIQQKVAKTMRPEVLGKIGGFGGLFRANFKGMKDPVLVSSVDGVGTKLKLAFALKKHDTVGQDLVNHCVNDIAVLGAEPLYFLDYIGTGKLEPKVFNELLSGLATACAQSGCALLGGETAQMPGIYQVGEYDLVGCIVGIVDKPKIVDGKKIKKGDVVIGVESSGLHTNGYSLARRILFDDLQMAMSDKIPGHKQSVGQMLLNVHINYLPLVRLMMKKGVIIKGMAHITGGGLMDNLPRVLPKSVDAVIDSKSWPVPPLFQFLCERGKLNFEESYQVFNMGIGYTFVVSPSEVNKALGIAKTLKMRAHVIGQIAKGSGIVKVQ